MPFIQAAGSSASGTTTLAVTFDSSVAVNSLIYVATRCGNGQTFVGVTDNKGGGSNTYTQGNEQLNAAATRATYFYAINGGAGQHTVAIEVSANSTIHGIVVESDGVETVSVLDVDEGHNADGVTALDCNNLPAATTVATAILLTAIATSADRTFTAPTNYTAATGMGIPTARLHVAYRRVIATGSYAASWGISSSADAAGVWAAFKETATETITPDKWQTRGADPVRRPMRTVPSGIIGIKAAA